MKDFKYEVKDKVRYDQGPDKWHHRGVATVIKQNGEFVSCVAYLLKDESGSQCEVTEEQILGLA